jgi:hypothetical protein
MMQFSRLWRVVKKENRRSLHYATLGRDDKGEDNASMGERVRTEGFFITFGEPHAPSPLRSHGKPGLAVGPEV